MSGTAAFRTPDDRFDGLSGYPYEPHYREWDGLRLAHVDEGSGEPILFVHGEPTWGYLWRKVMLAPLAEGYRCIVPDHPGAGRSDKPTDVGWYSYDRYTAALHDLVEQLDLRDATIVVHDWGGPIGLRVAAEAPDRFARIVALDTGLFSGEQKMSDAWIAFHDFVERTEDIPVGFLVKGACKQGLSDADFAAYEAPYPTPASKAGTRAFPMLIPTSVDAPGAAEGRKVIETLAANPKPALVIWGDSDPILPPKVGEAVAKLLSAKPPTFIEDSSHFLQEDDGETIGGVIVDWLTSQ